MIRYQLNDTGSIIPQNTSLIEYCGTQSGAGRLRKGSVECVDARRLRDTITITRILSPLHGCAENITRGSMYLKKKSALVKNLLTACHGTVGCRGI